MCAMSGRFEKNGHWVHAFILSAGFYILICVPMLQMTLSASRDHRNSEVWDPARKPTLSSLSLRGIRDYQKKYGMYFVEHFGFRNGLVRLNTLINMRFLHVSPSARVVLGRESWLFYDDPRDGVSLRDFRGGARFSDTDLQKARGKVIQLRQGLEKRGIKFLIVVAPNKHTIYPEYLPHDSRGQRRAITRLDQMAVALKGTGADFIDLRAALWAKKNSGQLLYSRTDTHWNPLGAFVAYEEIMKEVLSKGLKADTLRFSEFQVECRDTRADGDIARLINASDLSPDSEVVMRPLNPFRAITANVRQRYTSEPGRETIARERQGRNQAKLLMFRDSFATALIPYLSESFSRSVYVWVDKVDFSMVDDEKPHLVILEMAERLLGNLCNDDR